MADEVVTKEEQQSLHSMDSLDFTAIANFSDITIKDLTKLMEHRGQEANPALNTMTSVLCHMVM